MPLAGNGVVAYAEENYEGPAAASEPQGAGNRKRETDIDIYFGE